MTFRQLRVFVEVAERGSMLRAAEALHLTPPAVSVHVREIEKGVGHALFTRHKRRLSLSPAGEHFLIYAKRLLGTVAEADNAMAHFKPLDRGTLTIGIVSTAEYFVPRLLALFHAEHPGIDVKIRVGRSREQLVVLMDAAEIDLSVTLRAPKHPAARARKLAINPHVFICAPQHRLVGPTPVTIEALNAQPLIVREQGSSTREVMETFLAEHQCAPQISMEIASNETIKQSVMAGIGVGFLSLHCVGLELRNDLLRVLNVVDTPVMSMWHLVELSSRLLSPAAQAFRQFIIKHGEKQLRIQDAMLLSLAFKKKFTLGSYVGRKPRGGLKIREG